MSRTEEGKGMSGRIGRLLLIWWSVAAVAASSPIDPCPVPVPVGPVQPIALPTPGTTIPVAPPPRTSGPTETPVPSVAVRVRVPAEVAPGKELTYKIIAENCSKASAHHVTVRVTIPGSAARYVRATPEPNELAPVIVWKLGTLAPCQKRELTLVMLPTGDEEVSCCARVQFEHGQCVRTRIGKTAPAPMPPATKPATPPSTPPVHPSPPRTPPLVPVPDKPKAPATKEEPPPSREPQLQVRKLGPTEGAKYDILSFTLEVRNLGQATARSVIVRDQLPKGITLAESKPPETSQNPLTWNLGDLAPGATKTIQYKLIPDEVGSLSSVASVEAEGVPRKEVQHSVRVGQPALAVSIAGPVTRGVGREATYHLTVTNTGDLDATNVQLMDELKPDIHFVRASDAGRLTGEVVRWNLGTLAPGARRSVQLVVKSKRAGLFRQVCTATADRGLTEQAKVETTFVRLTGVAVEIDSDRAVQEVGKPIRCVVRVVNASNRNETNVLLKVRLGEELKLVEVPGLTGHEIKGSTILFPRRALLQAGEEAQVVLIVQGDKAGPTKLVVEVASEAIAPDKAIQVEEVVTILPTAKESTP